MTTKPLIQKETKMKPLVNDSYVCAVDHYGTGCGDGDGDGDGSGDSNEGYGDGGCVVYSHIRYISGLKDGDGIGYGETPIYSIG